MPDSDWMLSQGTVDFRNEERLARNGRSSQWLHQKPGQIAPAALHALEQARQAQERSDRRQDVQQRLRVPCPHCEREDVTWYCPSCGWCEYGRNA